MTLKNKIMRTYHKNGLVGICLVCQEINRKDPFQWLPNKIEIKGEQEKRMKPPISDYRYYTTGLCMEHYGIYKENGMKVLRDYIMSYNE